MTPARIRLSGVGEKLNGKHWDFEDRVRIGREDSLDLVLDDFSVEKSHAEAYVDGPRWMLRDLAQSDIHPTSINGKSVKGQEKPLQEQDIIQIGRMALRVTGL